MKERSPKLQGTKDYPLSSNPSKDDIAKFITEMVGIMKSLTMPHGCLQNLEGILQSYLSVIKPNPTIAGTGSGNLTNDSTYLNDEDEYDLDASSWREAYFGWLKGIARQLKAAGVLTTLSSSDKVRFAKIEFEVVEEKQPSNAMEPWEKTVNRIFVEPGNGETRDKVKKALSIIANNASRGGGDDDYKPLTQWVFDGAIHCEAIIAIHQIKNDKWRTYRPKFGVTKRCCVACSALLDAILGSVHPGEDVRSSTFLESSKKIWPCALPRGCPIDVAKKFTDVIDEHMRDMLKESLPRLQSRARKYSSSGSADDRSGQQDDEIDIQMDLLDTIPIKLKASPSK